MVVKREIFKKKLKPLIPPPPSIKQVIPKYYCEFPESSHPPIPTPLFLNIPATIPEVLNHYESTANWEKAEKLAGSSKLKEPMI
ncbi:MAG: hypothetical protein ABSA84_03125 [Gammaproteobacteria bacterium]